MRELTLQANAKVNIGLHIQGRRADGYHLMETLYYPVNELQDELVLRRVAGSSCVVQMQGIDEAVAPERNLCYRAWRALAEYAQMGDSGTEITVRKRIPAGAGLGGGSSNAAAVLKGLNQLWGLNLDAAVLAQIGEGLGADVPFFLYNRPLYATGIGTDFEEFPLDLGAMGYRLEVRTLPLHSSTPEAFKGLDLAALHHPVRLKELLDLPVPQWRAKIMNDLERPVFLRLPVVAATKAELYREGAVYAAMSGSGSACFGIFANA